MSISPTINQPAKASPKEKRFAFFRSRTLSGSSNESNGPSSPRLSPRSLFDKVRKRNSSNNEKTSTSSSVTQSASGPQTNSKTLTSAAPLAASAIAAAKSLRKRLSHSISEENDDQLNNEATSNSNTDLNYKTFHGVTQSFKEKLLLCTNNNSKNSIKAKQLLLSPNIFNDPNKVSNIFCSCFKLIKRGVIILTRFQF